MSKFEFSAEADLDLEQHLSYIIERDGIDRASNIYDQVMGKIEQIASTPFEIGQRKDVYIEGLRKVVFKRLNIYFRYIDNKLLVERIISGYRDQDRNFRK